MIFNVEKSNSVLPKIKNPAKQRKDDIFTAYSLVPSATFLAARDSVQIPSLHK